MAFDDCCVSMRLTRIAAARSVERLEGVSMARLRGQRRRTMRWKWRRVFVGDTSHAVCRKGVVAEYAYSCGMGNKPLRRLLEPAREEKPARGACGAELGAVWKEPSREEATVKLQMAWWAGSGMVGWMVAR